MNKMKFFNDLTKVAADSTIFRNNNFLENIEYNQNEILVHNES